MAFFSVFQPAMRRVRRAGRVLADLARIGSQLSELKAGVVRLGQLVDDLRQSRPASIYLGDHMAIARTRRGQRIFVDSRDVAIGIHLLTEGIWEEWIARRFERLVRPGATVIEVGANVGFYTLLGASLIGPKGRYFAFEANPHTSRLLTASVSINGFLDRVTVFHKAAHRERRTIPFYVLQRYPGSSSIHPYTRELLEQVQDEVRAIEVEAVPLDEVFADESFQVDLVKIDAEGSEPHVLRGMERLLARSRDVKIICEFDRGMLAASEDPRQFVDFVAGLGFRFWRIDPPLGDLVRLSADELLASGHIEVLMER